MKYKPFSLTTQRIPSPSMRREWIEMPQRVALPTRHLSPSMRREWIEISEDFIKELFGIVSLHAEGVD